MRVDRKTGEPILMEFRSSARAPDQAGIGIDLFLEKFPWRALLLGLFSFVSLLALFGPEGGLVGLAALCALVFVEMWNRRDFATPLRIVSQFGIFGTGRIEIPLEEIERVEFTFYTHLRRELDVGAVTVFGDRIALRFSCIPAPATTAQHILDLKHRNEVRREIAAGGETGEARPLLGSVVKESDLMTPISEHWNEDR